MIEEILKAVKSTAPTKYSLELVVGQCMTKYEAEQLSGEILRDYHVRVAPSLIRYLGDKVEKINYYAGSWKLVKMRNLNTQQVAVLLAIEKEEGIVPLKLSL